MSWRPNAPLENLKARAENLALIRRFFNDRGVMEVEVPVIGSNTVTDPQLDSLQVPGMGFLQTSPEYFMKRLLAAGSGDIYSLGKAFRADESGRLHNAEFTLLEWYRLGLDDRALASEVVGLIQTLVPDVAVAESAYADLFQEACGLNPHRATVEQLRQCARQHLDVRWDDDNRNVWLDLLFTHLVEPAMPDGLQVVLDFPASQAALARCEVNVEGDPVARRFEIYWGGVELANGYRELTDAREQRERFARDNEQRVRMGKPVIDVDAGLLAALSEGLPECAGVALGVDRLLMKVTGEAAIDQVISFAIGFAR